MPGIKIESDFWDYYDHWACGSTDTPDFTLERKTNSGAPKREQFKILEALGLKTPQHGTVVEVIRELHEQEDSHLTPPALVVYDDEMAHAGQGKRLMAYYHAISESDKYCSVFAPTVLSTAGAQSYRLLWIGDLLFCLQYSNIGDWRSNVGSHVSIEVVPDGLIQLPKPHRWSPLLKPHPLVAIDFVIPYDNPEPLAIDFNIAPRILTTGIERQLSPKSCYEAILKYATLNC